MPSKKNVIKTYVARQEYEQIGTVARQCGLSVSAFVKAVCLGHEIKSREDQQARRELLKINADLGRLGGLLKMWILDDDKHRLEVESLLDELRRRQRELHEAVKRI